MQCIPSIFGNGRLIGLMLLAVLLSLPAAPSRAEVLPSTQPTTAPVAKMPVGPAAIIQLAGEIDDFNASQLFKRFDRARRSGAKTIILEIDTYGGGVGTAMNISRFIKNQNDLYVVAMVNSKAISAGAMIAFSCDDIYMTPSATLGDCAPIMITRDGQLVNLGETERQKQESPIVADFRESAQRRGLSPAVGQAMVSLKHSLYWLENASGERRFVDENEHASLTASGQWKPVAGVPSPIDGPETLLTLYTEQAVQFGVARGVANSSEALAASRGWTVAVRYDTGWGDWVVTLLATPVARTVFLIIFLNALFIAIKTPGSGAAEAIAVLSLGMLLGMPLLTGHALWWQAVLVIAGVALVLFEVFVFPGVVVGLVAGLAMILVGIVLTFSGDAWSVPDGWSLQGTWTNMERGIWVTVGGLAGAMVLMSIVRRYLPQMPLFNRLILAAPAAGPEMVPVGPGAASEDSWPFPGTIGVTTTDLRPGGSAQFPYGADSRVTSVVGESGFVPAGTRVIVREVHGSRVVVRLAPKRDFE